MQLTTILFLAIQATGILAATAGPEDFAPDFENSSVPPVEEWGNYTAFDASSSPLGKRNCWSGSPYGCDAGKKRCWKVCGDNGQWCWTARGDGGGDCVGKAALILRSVDVDVRVVGEWCWTNGGGRDCGEER
ncbi:hypothetical protein VTL71DRAFT_7443 [Oculimacula yallundae]|uniref:Uncharacterized protein n=1 Tax=Oculimacula yallundae TaxID=86028 RepID=A0ABR4BU85_9HELO